MTGREYSTQQDIKKAAPRLKAWELPDSGVPGLVLKIGPSASKTWVIRYTSAGGRRNKKKLGRYPGMTVAMARTQALKVLGNAAEGADPSRDAKREKSTTLGVYIEGHYTEYAQQKILGHKRCISALEFNFSDLCRVLHSL